MYPVKKPTSILQFSRVLAFLHILLTLSSSGLGHRPFTAVTRVRIPLGSPDFSGDRRWRIRSTFEPELAAASEDRRSQSR